MDELKKKLEELGRAFEEFKRINDQRLNEIKQNGAAYATTESALKKANEDIDRLTKERDSMQKEIDGIKTAMNRSGAGAEDTKAAGERKIAEVKAAEEKYLRKGERALNDAELKLLSVDSNEDGGFLVRPELSAMIIKKEWESTPMRELAASATISSDILDIPVDIDEVETGWVGEQGARDETGTPTLKLIKIPAQELYAKPKATQRMLDDSAWNVEQWLAEKVGEKFGRDEATAFVSGNGVAKPRGFLSYANGTSWGTIEQVASKSALVLTADGLFGVQDALKESYQANATWLMKRVTVGNVRVLKDGQGRYIWMPGLEMGRPDLLLGRPVRFANDMPAEGAGNLAVAYGDFKKAYLIVDRAGTRVLRDPFTAKPYVIFYTTKRVGGDVVNFEALKLGVCSA